MSRYMCPVCNLPRTNDLTPCPMCDDKPRDRLPKIPTPAEKRKSQPGPSAQFNLTGEPKQKRGKRT